MERSNWIIFAKTGMLWFVNRLLFIFGWCIVVEQDKEGSILDVYPATTKKRGFSYDEDQAGYMAVMKYMFNNSVNISQPYLESTYDQPVGNRKVKLGSHEYDEDKIKELGSTLKRLNMN